MSLSSHPALGLQLCAVGASPGTPPPAQEGNGCPEQPVIRSLLPFLQLPSPPTPHPCDLGAVISVSQARQFLCLEKLSDPPGQGDPISGARSRILTTSLELHSTSLLACIPLLGPRPSSQFIKKEAVVSAPFPRANSGGWAPVSLLVGGVNGAFEEVALVRLNLSLKARF